LGVCGLVEVGSQSVLEPVLDAIARSLKWWNAADCVRCPAVVDVWLEAARTARQDGCLTSGLAAGQGTASKIFGARQFETLHVEERGFFVFSGFWRGV
jgi:hypothetical protein